MVFRSKKRVVEYDDVVNKQREIIYKRRRKILEESGGPELSKKSWDRIENEIESLVAARSAGGYNEAEISQMVREFSVIIPFDDASQKRLEEKLKSLGDEESMANHLIDVAKNVYQKRKDQLGQETVTAIEKYALWEQRINYGWSIWTCWMICGKASGCGAMLKKNHWWNIKKKHLICLNRC